MFQFPCNVILLAAIYLLTIASAHPPHLNRLKVQLNTTYRLVVRSAMTPQVGGRVELLSPYSASVGVNWKRLQSRKSKPVNALHKRSLDEEEAKPFQQDFDLPATELFEVDEPAAPDEPQLFRRSGSTAPVEDFIKVVLLTSSGASFKIALGKSIYLKQRIWVTAFPQLAKFCGSVDTKAFPWTDLTNPSIKISNGNSMRSLRVMQYMGLPPLLPTTRKYVVSLYVNPKALRRPCLNPSINQSKCDLSHVWETSGQLVVRTGLPYGTVTVTYPKWFYDMAVRSGTYDYNTENLENVFPWTRLGYTLDYGSIDGEGHFGVGATEFIVNAGGYVYVDRVETLSEHCLE